MKTRAPTTSFHSVRVPSPLEGREDGPCGHCVAEHDNVGGRFRDGFEEGGACVVLLLVGGEDIAREGKVGLDWRATGTAHPARSARADTSRGNRVDGQQEPVRSAGRYLDGATQSRVD